MNTSFAAELERATPAGRHRGAARALLEDLPVRAVRSDARPLARSYDEFLAAKAGSMQLSHRLMAEAKERARLFLSDVAASDGSDPLLAAMAKNLNELPSKNRFGVPLH